MAFHYLPQLVNGFRFSTSQAIFGMTRVPVQRWWSILLRRNLEEIKEVSIDDKVPLLPRPAGLVSVVRQKASKVFVKEKILIFRKLLGFKGPAFTQVEIAKYQKVVL